MGERPQQVFFDKGKEFDNNAVHNYLTKLNINFIHPPADTKAAIAERFNKTLQGLYIDI